MMLKNIKKTKENNNVHNATMIKQNDQQPVMKEYENNHSVDGKIRINDANNNVAKQKFFFNDNTNQQQEDDNDPQTKNTRKSEPFCQENAFSMQNNLKASKKQSSGQLLPPQQHNSLIQNEQVLSMHNNTKEKIKLIKCHVKKPQDLKQKREVKQFYKKKTAEVTQKQFLQQIKLYCYCSDLGITGFCSKQVYYINTQIYYGIEIQGFPILDILAAKCLSYKNFSIEIEEIVSKMHEAGIILNKDLDASNIIYSKRLSRFILKKIEFSKQLEKNSSIFSQKKIQDEEILKSLKDSIKVKWETTKPVSLIKVALYENIQQKHVKLSILDNYLQIKIINKIENYEQGYQLGRGTFGLVYIPKSNQFSAKKRVYYNGPVDMKYQQHEILNEIYLLHYCEEIVSPQILSTIVIKTPEYYQFQMQLCLPLSEIKFENNDFERLILQLRDDVNKLHSNSIFHRDIKPENICYSIKKKKLVLIDFGLAIYNNHSIQENHLSGFCGTVKYLSDEMKKIRKIKEGLINLVLNDISCLQKSLQELRKNNQKLHDQLLLDDKKVLNQMIKKLRQKQLIRMFHNISSRTSKSLRTNMYKCLSRLGMKKQLERQINFIKKPELIKHTIDFLIDALIVSIQQKSNFEEWERLLPVFQENYFKKAELSIQGLEFTSQKVDQTNHEHTSIEILKQKFLEFKEKYLRLISEFKIKTLPTKEAFVQYIKIKQNLQKQETNSQYNKFFLMKLYLILLQSYELNRQKLSQMDFGEILRQYNDQIVEINYQIVKILVKSAAEKSLIEKYLIPLFKKNVQNHQFVKLHFPDIYLKLNFFSLEINFSNFAKFNEAIQNCIIILKQKMKCIPLVVAYQISYSHILGIFYNTQNEDQMLKNLDILFRMQNNLVKQQEQPKFEQEVTKMIKNKQQQIQISHLKQIQKKFSKREIIQLKQRIPKIIPEDEILQHRNIYVIDFFPHLFYKKSEYEILISNYLVTVNVKIFDNQDEVDLENLKQFQIYCKFRQNIPVRIESFQYEQVRDFQNIIKKIGVIKLLAHLNIGVSNYKFFGADLIIYRKRFYYFVDDYDKAEEIIFFQDKQNDLQKFLYQSIDILHLKKLVLRNFGFQNICRLKSNEQFRLINLDNIRHVTEERGIRSFTEIIVKSVEGKQILRKQSGILMHLYDNDLKNIKQLLKQIKISNNYQIDKLGQLLKNVTKKNLNIDCLFIFYLGFSSYRDWTYSVENLKRQYSRKKLFFEKTLDKSCLLDKTIGDSLIKQKEKMNYCNKLFVAFNFLTQINFLRNFVDLIEINISNNHLDADCFSKFETITFERLETLNIWNNQIEDKGVYDFSRIYKITFPNVKFLNLSQNDLTHKSIEYLSNITESKIQKLWLSDNQIESTPQMELSLLKMTILKLLDLRNNPIQASSIINCSSIFLNLTHIYLSQLEFDNTILNFFTELNLIELELSNCKIGNDVIKILANSQKLSNLRVLILNNNFISNLSTLLSGKWKKIKKIKVENNNITKREINEIKKIDSKELTIQLQELSLTGNPIIGKNIVKFIEDIFRGYFLALEKIVFF